MRHTTLTTLLLLLFILAPGISSALMLNYFGKGSITGDNGKQHGINASMIISDKIQYWNNGPGKPIELKPGEQLPTTQLQFHIYSFSLVIDGIGELSGDGGYIYGASINPFGYYLDQWQLTGKTFSLGNHLMKTKSFFNKDGSPFQLFNPLSTDYAKLSPVINFGNRYTYYTGKSPLSYSGTLDLVMSAATPVPEPATLAYLGVGLIGVIGATRFKKRNSTNR